MADALALRGVTRRFAEFTLDGIGFALPEGYIMGLIGPNGSGKTTTVQLILNMLRRDAGEIQLFGKDNMREERAVKQSVGIVFDQSFFVDDWPVRDAQRAVAGFYGAWDAGAFARLLKRFELSPTKKIKELSRGMQMKLMLAAALSHDAKLLILDEPTSGLDPLARSELLDILQDYIQDGHRSVLFSTHITTDLERVADYITFLHRGKVVFTGEKDAFLQGYRIVRGDNRALGEQARGRLIGRRDGGGTFEGLALAQDAAHFRECVTEPATIDEIMIYTGREN
jgi:ABC-2 type transport system ATP-binding protein